MSRGSRRGYAFARAPESMLPRDPSNRRVRAFGDSSAHEADDRYVLCEINVSSVAPFPDSAIPPLVEAARRRLV